VITAWCVIILRESLGQVQGEQALVCDHYTMQICALLSFMERLLAAVCMKCCCILTGSTFLWTKDTFYLKFQHQCENLRWLCTVTALKIFGALVVPCFLSFILINETKCLKCVIQQKYIDQPLHVLQCISGLCNRWQLKTAATVITVGRGCKQWRKQPIVSTPHPQGHPQINIIS
jgi:hypothetical protein